MRLPVVEFQSLSRDSGRLNATAEIPTLPLGAVSIPQSGFGAFEHSAGSGYRAGAEVSIPQSGFGAFELALEIVQREAGVVRFNPSVGIRGV